MIALVSKPRVLFVPFSETPEHPNYREATWDEAAEQWRVPPEVNTIHGPMRSGTMGWRTGDQSGTFQENEHAPQQPGRLTILQGIRDGEVVKQAVHVRIDGVAARGSGSVGAFT